MNPATTRPSSSPASSWRKWPAFGDRGVVEAARRRGRAAGGSASIASGDRVGVAEGGEERLLPRRRAPPRRPVGLRWPGRRAGSAPGWASPGRRPCSPRSGNGASYAARTSSVIPRTQPAATSRPMSSTSAFSTALRNIHQISGMSKSPVGQPGVRRHHAREPVGVLGHQAQPDQPAPVLADQRHLVQVEVVEGQLAHPLDVPRERVVRQSRAACRTARTRPGPARRTGCRRR